MNPNEKRPITGNRKEWLVQGLFGRLERSVDRPDAYRVALVRALAEALSLGFASDAA